MPLLRFDSPVSRISGRLDGTPNTYTWNNGQPVLRYQPTVPNPQTDDQTEIRAIFSSVTKQWKLLTQSQRDAWTAFAVANKVTNRLGNEVGRNGLSAYVELATMHYLDTGTLLSAAPVLPRPAGPIGMELEDASQTGGNSLRFIVAHAYTTLTGLFLVTRATAPVNYESQNPSPQDYRLVEGVENTSIIALPASGSAALFTSAKYSYADQQWVGVECTIMNAEGWQSVATRTFGKYSI